jgi:hypothetical protein
LRARLARHVVERCLYGVDRNPMVVELARLALWVETLDRDLPFEYLDHKLKVGDSLVGCWLHLVEDYPARALDREGGDGAKGEWTKWLAARFKRVKAELPDLVRAQSGEQSLLDDVALPPADLVARVRARFDALHELSGDELERAYAELRASAEYSVLKQRMDLWCALWFWPPGGAEPPGPREWGDPSDAALGAAADGYCFAAGAATPPGADPAARSGRNRQPPSGAGTGRAFWMCVKPGPSGLVLR